MALLGKLHPHSVDTPARRALVADHIVIKSCQKRGSPALVVVGFACEKSMDRVSVEPGGHVHVVL